MLQTDVGDHAQKWGDEVGSIKTATEACLDDCHLDIALVEVVECHSCGHLEEREVELLHLCLVLIYKVYDLLLGNHLAIDAYALAEVYEVWRGEETCAVASLLKNRGEHMRYRALAISACYVDSVVVALWVAQVLAERCDTLKAWLVSLGTHPLE